MTKTAHCEILFGALANRLRCDILDELKDGEKCVNDLVTKLKTKQSLISHNLGILVKAGLVSQRREGTFRYYSIKKGTVLPAFALLEHWAAVTSRGTKNGYRFIPPALKNQPIHIFAIDKDGIITASEGYDMEQTGFRPSDALGKPAGYGLEDMPEIIGHIKRALAGERVNERVAGRGFVFELNIISRPFKDGKPDGAIGVVLSLGDKLEMEWKLRESEERWRSLVANAPTVIVAVDLAGRITYTNRALSDAPVEQIIGKSAYDFFTPKSKAVAERTLQYVLKTGERKHVEVEINGLDGVLRRFTARCGPILSEGRPAGMMIILTELP